MYSHISYSRVPLDSRWTYHCGWEERRRRGRTTEMVRKCLLATRQYLLYYSYTLLGVNMQWNPNHTSRWRHFSVFWPSRFSQSISSLSFSFSPPLPLPHSQRSKPGPKYQISSSMAHLGNLPYGQSGSLRYDDHGTRRPFEEQWENRD